MFPDMIFFLQNKKTPSRSQAARPILDVVFFPIATWQCHCWLGLWQVLANL
jgi:hypothetical protein